jgi:hypothetical protein
MASSSSSSTPRQRLARPNSLWRCAEPKSSSSDSTGRYASRPPSWIALISDKLSFEVLLARRFIVSLSPRIGVRLSSRFAAICRQQRTLASSMGQSPKRSLPWVRIGCGFSSQAGTKGLLRPRKSQIFPCVRSLGVGQEAPGSSPGATIFSRRPYSSQSSSRTFSAGSANPHPARICEAAGPGDRAGSGFQTLEERSGRQSSFSPWRFTVMTPIIGVPKLPLAS